MIITILKKHKTVSSLLLAVTVACSMFGAAGCSKKTETDNTKTGGISSSDQESGSVSQSTSAPDESGTTTDSTPDTTETTADSEPTSESTLAPYASLDEILIRGDKDYYVPFSNPEHSYSSVQNGWSAPVRKQGAGGCYAYASVTAMQIKYMQDHGELIDINPIDVIYRIFENHEEGDTYDEEKIYVDGVEPTNLGGGIMDVVSVLCSEPINGYVVTDASAFSGLSIDETKELIKEYGGLTIPVDYQRECKVIHGYETQNNSNPSTDHVATIVGWDDDFPADCFKTPASQNGAWLVQNSFGINWGNCGYYFVSYDQAISGLFGLEASNEYSSAIAYGRFASVTLSSPEDAEKLDGVDSAADLSIDDVNSWKDMSVASVYEMEGSVAAIGFWTVIEDQPYTIELRDGEFGDVLSTMSGSFDVRGYHTVKLDAPVNVTKFTVVVKTAGIGTFEGPARDGTANTAYASNYKAHFAGQTEPGRSFVEIGGEWVDVTAEDILTKMGLEQMPDVDTNTIGDPCITVLFD